MAEESQYGFKDKNKALDTIKLLKEKELNYQKLTVRGLLGRAKRVLTMTKAEEKIKNIKEAMQVFENWLKDHETPSSKSKSTSTTKSEKSDDTQKDKVPGLGFKDLTAAQNTIKALEGRDPKYQKLAIEGLIKSSKRVLTSTNNPDKIKSIKEAVKYLEDWLEDFESENREADNMDYIDVDLIQNLISNYKYDVKDKLANEFLATYHKQANGNYKFLRTLYPANNSSESWDIVRNKKLQEIKKEQKKIEFFEDDSQKPTKEHFKLIVWAYSPVASKLKSKTNKRSNEDDTEQSKKKKK